MCALKGIKFQGEMIVKKLLLNGNVKKSEGGGKVKFNYERDFYHLTAKR
jgi:hypothetical protein